VNSTYAFEYKFVIDSDFKNSYGYGHGFIKVSFDKTDSQFKFDRHLPQKGSRSVFAVFTSDENQPVGNAGGKLEISSGEQQDFVVALTSLFLSVRQRRTNQNKRSSMPELRSLQVAKSPKAKSRARRDSDYSDDYSDSYDYSSSTSSSERLKKSSRKKQPKKDSRKKDNKRDKTRDQSRDRDEKDDKKDTRGSPAKTPAIKTPAKKYRDDSYNDDYTNSDDDDYSDNDRRKQKTPSKTKYDEKKHKKSNRKREEKSQKITGTAPEEKTANVAPTSTNTATEIGTMAATTTTSTQPPFSANVVRLFEGQFLVKISGDFSPNSKVTVTVTIDGVPVGTKAF